MARRPTCPYELAAAGLAWWRWAWKTEQAKKWDASALYSVARRAQLEDELAALSFEDELDLHDLFAEGDVEAARRVEWALSALRRAATGSVTLSREMRALEEQLGLGPKAMAGLGWESSSPPKQEKTQRDELAAQRAARRGRAGAADPPRS